MHHNQTGALMTIDPTKKEIMRKLPAIAYGAAIGFVLAILFVPLAAFVGIGATIVMWD